jgi:class 3 adenylate cyclase
MTTRRLAAILAADVVGFSKLIGEDETGALAALREIRKGIVNPVLAEHGGRIFKLMGDGMLAEFPSGRSRKVDRRSGQLPWPGKVEDWHGKASGSADFRLVTLLVIRRRAHKARRLRLQEGLEGQVMLEPNIEGRGALLRRSVEALRSHP